MKHKACAVAASALFLTGIAPAIAQQYPGATNLGSFPSTAPGNSVYDRARPVFEAEGITAGDFVILPSITVAEFYDSNIFAADTGEVSSFVTFIGPQVEAVTEQGNFSLTGLLGGGVSLFEKDSNQNTEEFNASLRGQYRFSPNDSANARLEFRRIVVNRDDVEDGGGSGDPRMVHRIIGRTGYSTSFGGVTVDAELNGRDSDFQPSEQRDRDRFEYDGAVRVGYRTSRFITAFVEPNFEVFDFDTRIDDAGFARDAERYGARGGVTYELGDRVSAEAAVGVSRWQFDDSTFSSENIWSVDGSVGWNVTPLTTIKVSGSRDEVETTRAGASLKEVIAVNVGAEHEFRRDIITFVDAQYRIVDFNDGLRDDDNTRLSVGGEYFISKMFSLSGKYIYSERDSNLSGEDFSRDIVWLALQAQF